MKSLLVSVLGVFVLLHSNLNAQQKSPKLVVGIVVDQMCYEYLYRYQDQFSKGGFKKIMKNGANCRSTHYNYVPTYTGPGHASIYTGTTPNNHGIVANDWFSRSVNQQVNCVDDPAVQTVGALSKSGQYSPTNLKVNTITDQLKLERNQSKVISISIKNRGAILPGGHLSDGTYWYDNKTGNFVTSTFFKDALPQWVVDFNKLTIPYKKTTETWNTFFPIEQYTASGPDDSPYEKLLPGKTRPTFPYNLNEMATDENRYDLFTRTPFANTYLTDFAIKAIEAENLGKNGQTDMLCISYSSTDIIGHDFGPQSVEIEDTYIRLDRDIEQLLKELDKKVGKGNYTLFITADHAVVPVPQLLIDNQLPGGYVFLKDSVENLGINLTQKFGFNPIIKVDNLNVYLDRKQISENAANYNEICAFIQSEMRGWNGIKQVYTASELVNSNGDKWFEMIRNGYHPKESGDVVCILESGYLAKSSDTENARKGTSHGSPFAYDTHVPLLFYGFGIPKMELFRTIEITDIAPTIAHILNISFAHVTTGNPIVELLEKR